MKGVLFGFLVGGVNHDFRRTHNVDVHLHAHLHEEELGVGLEAVHLEDFRVVGEIHAHPEVGVHACGELAKHRGVFRNSDDGDDTLSLEAVLVHIGIFRVFAVLVGNVLDVVVRSGPADNKGQ